MARNLYATIGRAPDNDVVLDHATVSGHHARLSWKGASLVVEDLSSANGTFVDGERVTLAKTRPGAELRVGDVEVPWSHAGLRSLLKAGVGARTLVMAAAGARAYACGRCGAVSPLPDGAVPKALRCPKCGATSATATRPRGARPGGALRAALFVGAAVVGAAGVAVLVDALGLSTPSGGATPTLTGLREQAEDAVAGVTSPVHSETAKRLAAAIDPMDPLVRNTAVKLAAREEGAFHVAQVAEIWSAVRRPWRYVNDPEGREYFATAKESIENGYVGDCDDFAITLAAMVTAIGGKARVVLMDGPRGGHAYAEACVQGEPSKVAATLTKLYKTQLKRYLPGAVPSTIAYRSSDACPIWLNLDWNSAVPGGPYETERWAVAVYEDGRREAIAPAVSAAQPATPASR
jgi:ribosomal protein S27AE